MIQILPHGLKQDDTGVYGFAVRELDGFLVGGPELVYGCGGGFHPENYPQPASVVKGKLEINRTGVAV